MAKIERSVTANVSPDSSLATCAWQVNISAANARCDRPLTSRASRNWRATSFIRA